MAVTTTTTRVTTTKLATTNTSRCSRCSNRGSWGSTTMGLSRRVCLESPGSVFFFHINLTNGYLNTRHEDSPNDGPHHHHDPCNHHQTGHRQHLEVQQLQQCRLNRGNRHV